MSDSEEVYLPRKGKDPVRPEAPPLPRFRGGDLPDIGDEEPLTWEDHGQNGSALGLHEPLQPLPGWVLEQPSSEISTLGPAQLFNDQELSLDDLVPVQPLLSDLEALDDLRREYEEGNNVVYLPKFDWLKSNGFTHFRRTRGDGDCFYRATAFAYFNGILNAADTDLMAIQALSIVEHAHQKLTAAGFKEDAFESDYMVFLSGVHAIIYPERGVIFTTASLMQWLNDDQTSDSVVHYLRLLTSATIRENPDGFRPFLADNSTSLEDFCENNVEARGREADHVQIVALSRALQVNFDIAYLDGSRSRNGGNLQEGSFVRIENAISSEEYETMTLKLLYRPGHYDIL